MPGSSPMSPLPSPASSPSALDGTLSGWTWEELSALARDEANDRPFLTRLLELWSEAHGAQAAALYLEGGGLLELEVGAGDRDFPGEITPTAPPAGLAVLPLPGGALVVAPPSAAAADEPLTLLLTAAARGSLLKRRLKEQHFQVNYRGVELEALYDVGL